MILGFDLEFLRPIMQIGGTILFFFFCWRAYKYLRKIAASISALTEQFGTNDGIGLTLRDEITALSKRIDDLQILTERKITDRQEEIEKLQGLVKALQTATGNLGLEAQIRALVETYGKREVAHTVNVVQAGAGARMEQVAAGANIDQQGK